MKKYIILMILCLLGSMQAMAADIRIMSYNVRYGTAKDGENSWQYRKDELLKVLKDENADLLGLQEVLYFQLEEILDKVPGYQLIGVGRDDGRNAGEFSPILINKQKFELLDQGTDWLSDTPGVPDSRGWGNICCSRIVTWALLKERSSNKDFLYLNTHFDHQSQNAREKSAAYIVDKILPYNDQNIPIIVSGDFNSGEDNPAFQYFLHNDKAPLIDTFRTINPDAQEVGTFTGFTYGAVAGDKIDGIVVNEAWDVLDARIIRTEYDGRYPSDHFPVDAVLQLK